MNPTTKSNNRVRYGTSIGIGNQLFYITHISNIGSILKHGIFSHEKIEREGIQFTPIYDQQIVSNRKNRLTPGQDSLWNYANLYFQARNAMLYRVVLEKGMDKIAVVAVRHDVIGRDGVFISGGNAASNLSDIMPPAEGRQFISKNRKVLSQEYWKEEDGSKRIMMAECLVRDSLPPEFVNAIYVANHDVANELSARLRQDGVRQIDVIPEPTLLFQPAIRMDLTSLLSLVQGDLFFSQLQTLTVSVNTVGVMGKGLASRAKYQFPDVYVFYQDVCRNKQLRLGRPFLYKREKSFNQQMADDPESMTNGVSDTWFLLFATKQDWRQNADLQGITDGLAWLKENANELGIKSLALPALGCGLGNLAWAKVGPIICNQAREMNIPVWVYLPAEHKVPNSQLTAEFLLN